MRRRRIVKTAKCKSAKLNYLKLTSVNPLDYTIKQVTPRPNDDGEECDWAIIDSCGNIIELGTTQFSCKTKLRHMIEYFIVRKNVNEAEKPVVKYQEPPGVYQNKRPCPFCKSVGVIDGKCMSCRKVRYH